MRSRSPERRALAAVMARSAPGIVLALLIALVPTPACAHKLNVFASAEGKTIRGKVYFSGGTPAQDVAVTALGPAGQPIAQAKTDQEGRFTIEARFHCDYRLLAETGDGHGGEFTLTASVLPNDLPPPPGGDPKEAIESQRPLVPPASAPSPSAAPVSSDQLQALRAEIVRLEEQLNAREDRLRLTDILGGIGYIAGITGAAYYYLAHGGSNVPIGTGREALHVRPAFNRRRRSAKRLFEHGRSAGATGGGRGVVAGAGRGRAAGRCRTGVACGGCRLDRKRRAVAGRRRAPAAVEHPDAAVGGAAADDDAGHDVLALGALQFSREGLQLAVTVALKGNAVVLTLVVLLGTMDAVTLGHALRHLRVPEKLIHLMLFTVRYLDVLHREYLRLRAAMKMRGFRPGLDRHTYRTFGYLVGMLLVRSLDRAERIAAAMKCRGFRGHFFMLDHFAFSRRDVPFCIAWSALLLLLVLAEGGLLRGAT